MSNPDDPASWIAKADHDLLCIANNVNDPDVPWDVVCFHAQQAAEKMLKAVLVSKGVTAARTHDLGRLLADVLAIGVPLSHLQSDCDCLTPHAVISRYPGIGPDPTPADGREAVEGAWRIYRAVRGVLGLSSTR